MRKIQVLGPGCPKCKKLAQNTEEAIKELGSTEVVEKVTDINQITGLGVLMTPALVIDGKVKSSGKVLSVEEIKKLLG